MLTIAHIDYIRKMYFQKGLSYAKIENRIGHNYRTIKKYIELEDFNTPPKVKTVSLTLNHPGGEAQVDFGEIYIVEQGEMKKAHELVLSFPHSNAGFCQVTRSETMEALCEGLASIFKYTDVVPNKIWFD